MANDFLYVAGQGPVGRDGKVASDFGGQMRQAVENVKSVVTAGGLTMQHIVFAHVYLADMANYGRMNPLWVAPSPHAPPARAVLGVYKLPAKVYLSGVLGVDAAGKVPADPAAQADAAFDQMERTLAVAGLDYRHVVC